MVEVMYFKLKIEAKSNITILDDGWFFVQKGTEVLETALLGGNYYVEFTRGTSYPISLNQDLCLTQEQLELEPKLTTQVPKV